MLRRNSRNSIERHRCNRRRQPTSAKPQLSIALANWRQDVVQPVGDHSVVWGLGVGVGVAVGEGVGSGRDVISRDSNGIPPGWYLEGAGRKKL